MKSDQLQDKKVKLRLSWFKYFKKSKNIAKTCRYFGISRQTYYKWLKRYRNYNTNSLMDRSKRPKNIKYKLNLKITKKIKKLRLNNQLGPFKISRYLKNNEQIELSTASIYKILRKMKISRLSSIKKSSKN